MARAFSPGLCVSQSTALLKRRELPLVGEILVKQGESVTSNQIVARANLPGDLRILRVSDELGVAPHDINKFLKVGSGESVKAGGIIAEVSGLFGLLKTTVTAPVTGIIELISDVTGHVGLRTESKHVDRTAYVDGVVDSIEQGRSVSVRTVGAYLQGIFGVGGEQVGKLVALELSHSDLVTDTVIPKDCNGVILFGGCSPTLEALKLASARGARGLITGSIDDQALKGFLGFDLGIAVTGDEDISMSIIVTEGFGTIPMSERIYQLLTTSVGKNCSINGTTQVRAGAVRPEIIIPHLSDTVAALEENPDFETLEVGSTIRIIRAPYFGQRATVTDLPSALTKIETGAMARVLTARLEDGKNVLVPRANVERI